MEEMTFEVDPEKGMLIFCVFIFLRKGSGYG